MAGDIFIFTSLDIKSRYVLRRNAHDMKKIKILSLLFCLILMQSVHSQIELGNVNWLRERSEALSRSKESKKPVLILFQEVPGCLTCQKFGSEILTDPLIVEAIETLFVPLCIYNNKKGTDAEVLSLYNEPSWNNPVLRVTDSNGVTIQRLAGAYTKRKVLSFILDTYQTIGKSTPHYLRLMHEELLAEELGVESMVIETPCFWSGEVAIAGIHGVISTEAGWMGGREVVKLSFNPLIVDDVAIAQQARRAGVMSANFY